MIRLFIIVLLFISGGYSYAQEVTETNDVIQSESTVTSEGSMKTTIVSPPPSAISPQISASGSDLCTVGISGAVQTQILGISGGKTVRDMNCERLKAAKLMYDLGMKVAAVSVMCGDERVKIAMANSGTYCPIDGKIGDEAKLAWQMKSVQDQISDEQKNLVERMFDEKGETKIGLGVIISTLFLLLLL